MKIRLLLAFAVLALAIASARAQVEIGRTAATPSAGLGLFPVETDSYNESFAAFAGWLRSAGAEPWILRDPDLAALATLDFQQPESKEVVAPLAGLLSQADLSGLANMKFRSARERRGLLEALESARLKAAPEVERRLKDYFEAAAQSGDADKLARAANLPEGFSYYGEIVRELRASAALAHSNIAGRKAAAAAPAAPAAQPQSAAPEISYETAIEPSAMVRVAVDEPIFRPVRRLESDPARFHAAVEIVRSMHELEEVGKRPMALEALDYVLDYINQKPYSAEVRTLAFDGWIRDNLEAAPDSVKPKAKVVKSRLEDLVTQKAVNDRWLTRLHRRLFPSFAAAFVVFLEAELHHDSGWFIAGAIIFGVLAGLWGVIGLFSEAYWVKGADNRKSIRAYNSNYEFYNDTVSMRKKVRKRFKKFHSRQLELQDQALRLEGRFDANRGRFDPEEHLHAGEPFEIGIAKLLRNANAEVRNRARGLLEEMIGLEVLDSRRADDRDALSQLGVHIQLLEEGEGLSWKETKARVAELAQATLKRADVHENDEFYQDLASSLDSAREAAEAPRARIAEAEEAEDAPEAVEEAEKVKRAPRS